jgi:beta-glucosidase/6-phospho-beta-glucosidase/beta-galactosidase
MGARTYSFSISWSRVMPLGSGYVSQEGLDFYKNLTREIKKNGMKPVATLFHWDTPLALEQDYGSFTSERIVDDFTNYAALMFKELGAEGVDTWITFNEPPGKHMRGTRGGPWSDIFPPQSSARNASCCRSQAFVVSMLHLRTPAGYARATCSKHTAGLTNSSTR